MTTLFRLALACGGAVPLMLGILYGLFGFGAVALALESFLPLPQGFDAAASIDIDSELRALSVPLAAIGAAALWLALVYPRQRGVIPWMLLTVFLAGLARIVPIWQGFVPSPMSLVLMAAEIGLPAGLAILYVLAGLRR